MPADKRKMWLGDGIQFYEPIAELGGTFETRLGNFHRIQANGENSQSVSALTESSRKLKRSNNQFQRAC